MVNFVPQISFCMKDVDSVILSPDIGGYTSRFSDVS